MIMRDRAGNSCSALSGAQREEFARKTWSNDKNKEASKADISAERDLLSLANQPHLAPPASFWVTCCGIPH